MKWEVARLLEIDLLVVVVAVAQDERLICRRQSFKVKRPGHYKNERRRKVACIEEEEEEEAVEENKTSAASTEAEGELTLAICRERAGALINRAPSRRRRPRCSGARWTSLSHRCVKEEVEAEARHNRVI